MQIRPESPEDFASIRHVVAAAFGSRMEADLVERIRLSPQYRPELSLVAVDDAGEVIGHVMIDGCTLVSDAASRSIVMLSPLAVAPSHQRRGVGSALIDAAVRGADAAGEPLVVLEGSPTYYGQRGFEPALAHGIMIDLPEWAPPEAAQVRLLSAYDASDPTLCGRVVYPPAFDGIE